MSHRPLLSPRRAGVILALILLAAGAPAAADEERAAACEGFQVFPGVGPACPVAEGLRLTLPDGRSVLTHGADPAPQGPTPELDAAAGAIEPRNPVCVERPEVEHHTLLVYAVPTNVRNAYATRAPQIRDLMARANAILYAEAQEFGATAEYRVACTGGLVDVANVALSTSSHDTTFYTIMSDLDAQGYNRGHVKYLVWAESTLAGIGGIGQIASDDTLSIGNMHNRGPFYAVNFGYMGGFGVLVMMHESGHNLGAVQTTAPHSSGAWHCNDGRDILCYADGGSRSSYSDTVCRDRSHFGDSGLGHFDCGHDDYFNPTPAEGSYLARKWNLGSRYNRYFQFGGAGNTAPVMSSLSCHPNPAMVGQEVACFPAAQDVGWGLVYTLTWGEADGAGERFPAAGYVTPGSGNTVRHTWNATGSYTVTAYATDVDGSPLSSAPLSYAQRVICHLASGKLTLGLLGVAVENVSARTLDVSPGCAGHAFALRTTVGSGDFDLCWLPAEPSAAPLACHRSEGNEAGAVPEGATRAQVILKSGNQVYYRLSVE